MPKAYYVQYKGDSSAVHHPGRMTNAYHFYRKKWIEVHKDDYDRYVKKSKKNSTWIVKMETVPEEITSYHVKFLGIGKQKTTEIKRHDYDDFEQILVGTEREYKFSKNKWLEIDQKDCAFFKRKADSNPWWEYDKRINVVEAPKKELLKETKEEKKAREKLEKEAEKKRKEDVKAEAKKLKLEEEEQLRLKQEADLKAEEDAKKEAETEPDPPSDPETEPVTEVNE